MFIRCIFILCCCSILQTHAQTLHQDSLYIGKRGNVVWNRPISTRNIGNVKFTSYYTIFYRHSSFDQWRRVGLLGKNIEPLLLNKNDNCAKGFLQYKKNKKESYWLLGLAGGFLASWTLYTAIELNRSNSIQTYIKPIPLALLAGFELCFYLGKQINNKGDQHLNYAVYYYNKF